MSTKVKKTRFIPNDYTLEFSNPELQVELYSNKESLGNICYTGKSTKPVFYYKYKDLNHMQTATAKRLNNLCTNLQNELDRKNKIKLLNKTLKASDHFKEGDVVVNSWGFEQTNVDFYKVVKVNNKTIDIVEICKKTVPGTEGFMCCDVLPDIENEYKDGKSYTLRMKSDGKDGVYLSNPQSYYYFSKHDGRQMYNSWYA